MNNIIVHLRNITTRMLAVVFCVVVISAPLLASAQEKIDRFEADISIQEDSSVVITEEIRYDFNDTARHGIFRTIPTRYKTDSGDRTIDLEVISVQREGADEPYEVSEGYSETEVKIGDPDERITGEHTYTIEYRVQGALNYFEEFDELYWNVTGTAWDVPIQQAGAEMRLPQKVNQSEIEASCYEGPMGADASCGNISIASSSVTATASGLDAGEGLTLAVGFPKGVAKEPSSFAKAWRWIASNSVLFLPLFVFAGMFFWWYRRGRDPEGRGTIITQYEPPKGMTPTMVGTLIDEKVHDKDITAGIISLAQKGFIHIKRLEGKTLLVFDTVDYQLQLKRPASEVENGIEQDILQLVMGADAEVGDTIQISELKDDTTVAESIQDLKQDLNEKMVDRGYFANNPRKITGWYWAGGFMIVWILGVLTSFFDNPLFILSGIVSGIIIAGFGYLMPRKTKKGAKIKEKLLGFKDFLTITQEERLEFHNAPERDPEQFMEYLSFAVALDVEEAWAKQFEDMYIEAPEWYHGAGSGRIAAAAFAGDLSEATSGISSSVSSAAASGASGSGGGGFSGGGMGGGGGGSW